MTAAETLNIIVDGPTDAAILRAVLPKENLPRMRFYAGGGKIALATIGRNILVYEGGAVLIVMDADTLKARRAEDDEAMTRLALRNVAPAGHFDVFAFLPQIEVIFFEVPDPLERWLGHPIPKEKKARGLLDPQQTLRELLSDGGKETDLDRFVASINASQATAFRNSKQMGRLVNKVETLMKAVSGSGVASGTKLSAAKT